VLPFKRILCPTDFSEPAGQAVQAAVELARHCSALLLLVHVVPPVPVPYQPLASPGPSFDVTAYLQELTNTSQQTLKAYAEARVPPEVAADLRVSAGDPALEILRQAQESAADLIVIATHGHGGWRRFLFGSVAEKVVRQATCPVLVVHAP
jgi:universal stress protein A